MTPEEIAVWQKAYNDAPAKPVEEQRSPVEYLTDLLRLHREGLSETPEWYKAEEGEMDQAKAWLKNQKEVN